MKVCVIAADSPCGVRRPAGSNRYGTLRSYSLMPLLRMGSGVLRSKTGHVLPGPTDDYPVDPWVRHLRAHDLDQLHRAAFTIDLGPREPVLASPRPRFYSHRGTNVLLQPEHCRCVVLCTGSASTVASEPVATVREFLGVRDSCPIDSAQSAARSAVNAARLCRDLNPADTATASGKRWGRAG